MTASEKLSFERSSESLQMTPQGNLGYYSIRTDSPTKAAADSFTSGNSSHGNSDSSDAFSFLSSIDTPFNFFSSNNASSDNLESSVASESPRSPTLSQTPGLEAEKRRIRLELTKAMEMYNLACKEIIVARQKARDFQQWQLVEERKLEEAQLAEEAALALAKVERQKTMAALEAAKMQQRLAEMQTQKRENIEMQAKQKRAVDALPQNNVIYRRYSIDEIEKATDYFNSSLKIGEGGYGPVYKGLLDHTAVAIKILRPDLSQGQKQFQQEVEVLSSIRHPHMVLLLGACPEYGCLVYEYMDNGSLEDRLFQKDSTPPISWPTRFRIAAEIASGLLFLHQTKPEPTVHRDLKPGNILLDLNYRSKIGDVGLARLIPPSVADSITQYHVTSAAGTFCYIDPEYQQTGLLGVKSDVYSLGVMLLQLLTAKPPIGLAHQIEKAIKKDKFPETLDPSVTDWPIEDALSLAKLALKCCEMRKRDRPDLDSDLLPELERLRDLGIMYSSLKNMAIDDGRRPYNSVPEVRPTVNQGGEIDPDLEVDLQWRSI
ncbi:U-box domain-containing protein 52-like [Juglans microcarpa x Juglans regia]|uniref:U-box domain-containing protein 52-like n=1 Tax=Juglans microcarpa x Juglans regia TaxID=2249226 RepID=UPI001B7ED039|nr:U-box domain-containing protein 52-like [Juglans microcarpa x Juglans regia]